MLQSNCWMTRTIVSSAQTLTSINYSPSIGIRGFVALATILILISQPHIFESSSYNLNTDCQSTSKDMIFVFSSEFVITYIMQYLIICQQCEVYNSFIELSKLSQLNLSKNWYPAVVRNGVKYQLRFSHIKNSETRILFTFFSIFFHFFIFSHFLVSLSPVFSM